MKKWLILGLLLAAGALTSCGLEFGFKQYYHVTLSPAMWGFEVTDTGLKVVGNQAQVMSQPGAPEGMLEGVVVRYFRNGVDIGKGYEADLRVFIPAGIVCTGGDGDAAVCTKADANWSYGVALSEAFQFPVDGDIPQEMYNDMIGGVDTTNWIARVTFQARTSGGKAVQWEQDIKVIVPLDSGG